MIPVTSRGCPDDPHAQPVAVTALPSIRATLPKGHLVRIYVGYDSDDLRWADNGWRADALAPFADLSIRRVPIYAMGQRITAIWNWMARRCYDDGADYFVAANDDLLFQTPWGDESVRMMSERGLSLLAWHDDSFPGFPTFHMSAREHLDVFGGVYYPLPFHGAHQDPWIYDVYRQYGRAELCDQIRVRNHVGGSTVRYEYGPQTGYRSLVTKGRHTVAGFYGLPFADDAPTLINA